MQNEIHSEIMQLVAQLVIVVEHASLRWGTELSEGYSHYEEEYLIGSKIKE